VTPALDTVRALGDSVLFTAAAKDSSDSTISGASFTWASSDTLIAKARTTGRVLALAAGTVTITATTGSVSGTAAFTDAQRVASVTISPDTITVTVGATPSFTAAAKDSNANAIAGATFTWGSTNPLIATVNVGGVATAIGTGIDTITATSGGVIGRATLTVTATVHTTDIITNTTWTLAQSPHRVSGVLRVRSNATLTIDSGVTVKFDTLSGLQIGDTSINESGGLVMNGGANQIKLTASSATPVSGFWRGLEVQRSLAVPPWRKVLLEWAGAGNRPCILIADRLGVALDLDSLHLRQCGGLSGPAGLLLLDGSVHLHRSEVDTTGSAGASAINGTLEVDSTTFRDVNSGILFTNQVARLGPSAGNKFFGDNATVRMTAFQLPGLLRQDTISGNVFNQIIVASGQPDGAAASLTLFHHLRLPNTGLDYQFTSGAGVFDIG